MAYDMVDGDGNVIRNVAGKTVYVNSEEDLAAFADEEPGTFAVQYGLGTIWQKKPDGDWAEV